jgi:arginine deiminase
MIFQGVTLNPMYWPARRQETLLTTAVYRFHPAFADEKFDVWLGDLDAAPVDTQMATLEGGDVMPIGKGILVIGMGERTSHQAISQVATSLFAGGAAERIIVASLLRNRAAMHLDTVFTFCGPETAFTRVTDMIVPFSIRPDDATSSGLDIRREEKPFVETLEAALDVRFQVVATGGDVFGAEREQWDDGNNVVALACSALRTSGDEQERFFGPSDFQTNEDLRNERKPLVPWHERLLSLRHRGRPIRPGSLRRSARPNASRRRARHGTSRPRGAWRTPRAFARGRSAS